MANEYDWLKQLKPGDPVVVCNSKYGYRSYNVEKVERITPSGIIVVEGSHYKPTDGFLRGGDSWSCVYLKDFTSPDVKEEVEKYKRDKYVSDICYKFRNVTPTYDQARQIALIMGWGEEDLE